ncbi:poly(R)-hydroxyalkanoic acid synthase subunit PhaE [Dyella amyloliquefaciens]|uniref:poly(R)-hydroxyalkanoic acid synthase subunit PhaE n=1 Tax=Dyella amyloliquefaciens TaxID=1770545 RepID=UPI00102E59BE|nr:poly(R)-hydroxyalkanoic acid synthase subunit PhaE [Dyella amyloliquefaciens]
MADQASDFLKDYQALAQQSWDTWTRYLQQQTASAAPCAQAASSHAGAGDDLLARSMAALKGYNEWLQGAVGSGLGQGSTDWQQSLQNLFSSLGGQPFAHAFASIDSEAARSFGQLWQSWLQSSQSGMRFDVEHMAAFGFTRERQLQQQEIAAAMQEYLDWSSKYQALIQRANTEGFERLQAKLADFTDSTRQIESLKALYDLWVDGAEEAYAQIALSEEFRHVYGEMVNAQGRLRQLQQQQLEAMCRELGMPTRSEVSALGKRLQELRREVRGQGVSRESDELATLRAEVAALKRQLAGKAGEAKRPASRSSKREPEKDAVVRRAKPAATVGARKTVARGTTRTRK